MNYQISPEGSRNDILQVQQPGKLTNTEFGSINEKKDFYKQLAENGKLGPEDLSFLEKIANEKQSIANDFQNERIETFIKDNLQNGFQVRNQNDFLVLKKSMEIIGLDFVGVDFNSLKGKIVILQGNKIVTQAEEGVKDKKLDLISQEIVDFSNIVNKKDELQKQFGEYFGDIEHPNLGQVITVLKNESEKGTRKFAYALQVALAKILGAGNRMGYVDGYVGKRTKNAIIDFQWKFLKGEGILANGKLGQKTLEKIIEKLGGKKSTKAKVKPFDGDTGGKPKSLAGYRERQIRKHDEEDAKRDAENKRLQQQNTELEHTLRVHREGAQKISDNYVTLLTENQNLHEQNIHLQEGQDSLMEELGNYESALMPWQRISLGAKKRAADDNNNIVDNKHQIETEVLVEVRDNFLDAKNIQNIDLNNYDYQHLGNIMGVEIEGELYPIKEIIIKGKKIYTIGYDTSGYGIQVYSNGSKYKGEINDNKRNGIGTYTWPDGDVYTGTFQDGMLHGTGKYTWHNGNVFTGEWKNDLKDGGGIFTEKSSGRTWKEIWKDRSKISAEEIK